MKIPSIIIKQYLSLVNDLNPLHYDIVPGQLICEIVFGELNVHWSEYNIKYLKPVGIADNL
ncbi:hypothetical protein [Staphylococcus saccharolyticus]|uniref:hypothetical protein n=1 Tax=Staphylococcus saccharolyticus TaxID=33028 RepID=UPI0032E0119E